MDILSRLQAMTGVLLTICTPTGQALYSTLSYGHCNVKGSAEARAKIGGVDSCLCLVHPPCFVIKQLTTL